jgi:hypothetical protein
MHIERKERQLVRVAWHHVVWVNMLAISNKSKPTSMGLTLHRHLMVCFL